MIAPSNGEVGFTDGLCIPPFAVMERLLPLISDATPVHSREIPVAGRRQFDLGAHNSDHGVFAVETSVGSEGRVEAVFLSHKHSFYDTATPADAE